jgi:hypothetical protein
MFALPGRVFMKQHFRDVIAKDSRNLMYGTVQTARREAWAGHQGSGELQLRSMATLQCSRGNRASGLGNAVHQVLTVMVGTISSKWPI